MAISQETIDQIARHLVRPLAIKVANLAGRATIQLVDDSGAMQRVQLGGIVGAPYDGAEHFQPWGISAVPLPGASCIVLFPSGDRGHPLVFAVADPDRPAGRDPGTFAIYNHTGASVTITKDGNIVAEPATGRQVLLGSAAAAQGAVKGTQRDTAEQIFLTAMQAFASSVGGLPGMAGPAATFVAAIGTFSAAVTAAISPKVKLE